MVEFYNINLISDILKKFKVKKIVVSGVSNEKLLNIIFNHGANIIQVDSFENPLNALLNFENYDAIFIDDDPNWYTIFNELNIIKDTNKEFPLVFICNNKFPNKTRDSYRNPDIIPKEFMQKYTKELPICHDNTKIIISDGFYHACEENTPKNGVSTGINDFLKEYSHVGVMNIHFIEEITILYLKLPINQKRINSIIDNSDDEIITKSNMSDKFNENQLLISYIDKYNMYNENFNKMEVELNKNKSIINEFENEISNQNIELNYKESHINNIKSKLSLKDSQIKNFESKLLNKNQKIADLEKKLKNTNDNLNHVTQKMNQNEVQFNNKINTLKNNLVKKENDYNEQISEFKQNEAQFNNLVSSLNKEIEQNNEKYVGELSNKNDEIKLLKEKIIKKETEFNEIENNLGNQLKRKNSDIENKEKEINLKKLELDNKQNQLNVLEHSYTKQLSEIESKKYCISCFKDEISNKRAEISYLNNNSFIKKILSPLSYLFLILKSKPRDISLNINLYKILKDSKCFDIGFYLNNNADLIDSYWLKYLSPELHYVCYGFKEQRKFNKKYFNRNSKEELLDYLLKCDD